MDAREGADLAAVAGGQLRRGSDGDSRACFDLFVASVSDLGTRLGVETITGGAEALDPLWAKREPLFRHLAETADAWWVGERDGHLLGYARSIMRDGVRQLTEFFVRPGEQSAGLGGALLDRAFGASGAGPRILLATPDERALVRYLKAGMCGRFPVFHFHRARRAIATPAGLRAEPLTASATHLEALARIDRDVLGFRRDPEHRWLIDQRQGFLYFAGDRLAGYGYTGLYAGPFAALVPGQFALMLAHAEGVTKGPEFGVEAPLINRAALDYLLAEGFRMDPFVNHFMSDRPIGHLDRYLVTTPSIFI